MLLVLVISCSQKQQISMVGAYSMMRQVLNDGSKDSSLDRKQLKIYTTNYMMYASPNVNDSFANFGVGRYEVNGDKLTEYRFYTAESGEKNDTFTLSITKNIDGYTQVIQNMVIDSGKYTLTEDYTSVGTDQKSDLDGIWKQVKNIYYPAKGDSSVNNNPLEYKSFEAGYFIWAITVTDSLNKKTSVFGYGHFEMQGKNKSRETVVNSTFRAGLVGKTYEVDIVFNGKDEYSQTITFANGDRSTEIYRRLK